MMNLARVGPPPTLMDTDTTDSSSEMRWNPGLKPASTRPLKSLGVTGVSWTVSDSRAHSLSDRLHSLLLLNRHVGETKQVVYVFLVGVTLLFLRRWKCPAWSLLRLDETVDAVTQYSSELVCY